MKAKSLIFAAAISLAPTASYANVWFVENAADATCDMLPADGFTSPSDAQDGLRSEGIIPHISEDYSSDGSISIVTMSFYEPNGNPAEIQFFTSEYLCEGQLQQDLKNGTVTDPNILK